MAPSVEDPAIFQPPQVLPAIDVDTIIREPSYRSAFVEIDRLSIIGDISDGSTLLVVESDHWCSPYVCKTGEQG
jgi:hypothetical protein